MSNINQYPLEALQINDEDFYDVDYWTGAAYESRKISGLTLKSILGGLDQTIYNIDGTLTGNRTAELDGFEILFEDSAQNRRISNSDALILIEAGDTDGSGIRPIFLKSDNVSLVRKDNVRISLDTAALTTTRNQQFQDNNGVIALLSDIPAPSTDTNIYSDSGTLTGARFLTLDGNVLYFTELAGQTEFRGNTLTIQANAGQESVVRLSAGNGENRGFEFLDQGDNRWKVVAADLESGLNSGTNFKIERYDDAGVLIGVALEISRASGEWTVNNAYSLPDLDGNPNEVLTTNGLGVSSWQLPVSNEKFVHHSYAYDMSLAAGYLWNTVNVAAASITSFNESYRAIQFAGVGGADGCFINATLPSYYPSNTTVKVTINFTTDGTGGDVRFYMGLQKPNGANYGDDTTTEWKFFTFTANAGLPTGSNTLLFNGTGLTALLPISVKVFRDPGDVNDTYNGDAFVTNLLIEIV